MLSRSKANLPLGTCFPEITNLSPLIMALSYYYHLPSMQYLHSTLTAVLCNIHCASLWNYWKYHNSKDRAPLYGSSKERPLNFARLHFLASNLWPLTVQTGYRYLDPCGVRMLKKKYCTKQTKARRERHRLALTYLRLNRSEVVNLSTLPHMPNEAGPTHYERIKTEICRK